ncbi:unnamed protein product, partial [Musa acuminata var. zebrina]
GDRVGLASRGSGYRVTLVGGQGEPTPRDRHNAFITGFVLHLVLAERNFSKSHAAYNYIYILTS